MKERLLEENLLQTPTPRNQKRSKKIKLFEILIRDFRPSPPSVEILLYPKNKKEKKFKLFFFDKRKVFLKKKKKTFIVFLSYCLTLRRLHRQDQFLRYPPMVGGGLHRIEK